MGEIRQRLWRTYFPMASKRFWRTVWWLNELLGGIELAIGAVRQFSGVLFHILSALKLNAASACLAVDYLRGLDGSNAAGFQRCVLGLDRWAFHKPATRFCNQFFGQQKTRLLLLLSTFTLLVFVRAQVTAFWISSSHLVDFCRKTSKYAIMVKSA